MTKTNMINAIIDEEAKLWLDLHEYDNANAPDNGSLDEEMYWECNDEGHLVRLCAWGAIHDLIEKLGIENDHSRPEHEKASELSHELFIRRQANKGIFYNERGNEISA